MIRLFLTFLFIVVSGISYAQKPLAKISHVVFISFDGFRPDLITALGEEKATAFHQMIKEGASTLNARTDYDYTITLPNHTCMITGYPVMGKDGHGVIENTLMVDKTVHDFAGRHVSSIFDVLHKNNLRGAMLASKLKFNIYQRSFPIDIVSLTDYDDSKTLDAFLKLAKEGLPEFVFIHFAGTDRVGHKDGWDVTPGSPYMSIAETLSGYLGKMLKEVGSNEALKDSTVVIVTSDHGGEGRGHSDNMNPRDYTIPFIIWGKAVAKGADLYKINNDRRKDPAGQRIPYSQEGQPIRNGDAANLSLSLLGLSSVEGSTIGKTKPLRINEDQN